MKTCIVPILVACLTGCAGHSARRSEAQLDELASRVEREARAKPVSEPADPSVIATGQGVRVTYQQLDRSVFLNKTILIEQGAIFRPGVTSWLRQDVLQILIWFELLWQKATPDDLNWGQDKAQQRLDILIKHAGGEEEFQRRLKPLYASVEEARGWLLYEAVAEAVLRRELALRHAVANDAEPAGLTEDQIKEDMRPYLAELWLEAGVRISDSHLNNILAPKRPN